MSIKSIIEKHPHNNDCETCANISMLCFKHKPPETKEERQERKDMWVSRAMSMGAELEEAVEKWEKENK